MDLNQYKKSLTRRCIRLTLLGAVLAVFWAIFEISLKNSVPGLRAAGLNEGISGFICGAFSGYFGFLAFYLLYAVHLIRNPELLKKRYQQKYDERELFICRQTGITAWKICLIVIYLAMIVSAVFSKTVFFTLYAVLALLIVVYLLCRLHYRRKY